MNGKSAIEHELGCIHGHLELKYANPTDGGYTYIANDGKKVPLTPTMILEWVRAIVGPLSFIFSGHVMISILRKYDMTATLNHLPNTTMLGEVPGDKLVVSYGP